MDRIALPGSTPVRAAGVRREHAADPEARISATFVLCPADPPAVEAAVKAVDAFARASGLDVTEADAAKRSVVVSGSVSQMSHAFGVNFAIFASPDGSSHLSYDGELTLPSDIAPSVMAVLGLDQRPAARTRH